MRPSRCCLVCGDKVNPQIWGSLGKVCACLSFSFEAFGRRFFCCSSTQKHRSKEANPLPLIMHVLPFSQRKKPLTLSTPYIKTLLFQPIVNPYSNLTFSVPISSFVANLALRHFKSPWSSALFSLVDRWSMIGTLHSPLIFRHNQMLSWSDGGVFKPLKYDWGGGVQHPLRIFFTPFNPFFVFLPLCFSEIL